MKNRLEAELVSIAHRVLKLKGKSDVIQLQAEALNLYEKLSILRFVEEYSDDALVVIPDDMLEKVVQKQPQEVSVEANPTSEIEEPIVETQTEVVETLSKQEEILIKAIEETSKQEAIKETQFVKEEVEVKQEEVTKQTDEPIVAEQSTQEPLHKATKMEDNYIEEAKESLVASSTVRTLFDEISEDEKLQNQFEDFESQLSEVKATKPSTYMIPIIFEELTPETVATKEEPKETVVTELFPSVERTETPSQPEMVRTVSINDAVKKNFNIGLNDKIAFEFHLFNGDKDRFERVIAQLNVYTNFADARNYIERVVKPEYQYWNNKAEYEARFLEIIESKFL